MGGWPKRNGGYARTDRTVLGDLQCRSWRGSCRAAAGARHPSEKTSQGLRHHRFDGGASAGREATLRGQCRDAQATLAGIEFFDLKTLNQHAQETWAAPADADLAYHCADPQRVVPSPLLRQQLTTVAQRQLSLDVAQEELRVRVSRDRRRLQSCRPRSDWRR